MSLPNLLQKIRACTLCADQLPLGPRPVVQVSTKAKILIAGQAPGRKVHETGIPFDDPSGDRLRNWLGVDKASFYNPEHFAIVPMGFCFPGTGHSGDLPPRPECAPKWRTPLLSELDAIALTLVIGNFSRSWHLPETSRHSLTNTVQNWQNYWPGLMPLPHPSPRNIRWFKTNPWFEAAVIPALQVRIRQLLP